MGVDYFFRFLFRWGWKRTYANRMIGAAKVANALAPTGAIPQSEWITRPLTTLPKETQVEAWGRAIYTARGKGAHSRSTMGFGDVDNDR
jgi:hypothetical protein